MTLEILPTEGTSGPRGAVHYEISYRGRPLIAERPGDLVATRSVSPF